MPLEDPQPAVAGGAYDEVPYPGFAYPQTHPDRLATQALLFGMLPAAPGRCRVLELGCGDGGNLIPMALGLPHSEFVGVDAAVGAIERGEELARTLGLRNIVLRQLDLAQLPDSLGSFDYVIAHGVYSWVPVEIRDALMAVCRRHLAPHGVAYVSYNAYPGSHLRNMAREMMLFHLQGASGPDARVREARAFMEVVVDAHADSPFARVLREQMERLLRYDEWLLFHDDLAEINTPVYFHELVAHAARHGLQFLSEADLFESQLPEIPEHVAAALERLGDDVVLREQYMDFIKNRMFRQTLLCHADVTVDRALDPADVTALAVASPARPAMAEPDIGSRAAVEFQGLKGAALRAEEPIVKSAMMVLYEAWPEALAFSELAARARARLDGSAPGAESDPARDVEVLSDIFLRAYAANVVELHSHPPRVAARAGERPVASALARRQAEAGDHLVTNLRHRGIRLEDDLARGLLTLLDGSRDRPALLEELRARVESGERLGDDAKLPPAVELARALDDALDRLAELSLLEG